jgi:uncharacterized protein (TIGR03000 family)
MLAFAGIGLLLVTGSARAQQGWPINGSNWSYYGGGSRGSSSYSPSYYPSYSPSYYSGPAISYGGYSYAPAFADYYYNGALTSAWTSSADYSYGAYSPTQKNTAHIRLVVPADARVWFGDEATKQRGETRHFESPALEPGHQYVYDVKVRWRDKDGQEVTRTRQLNVSANDNVSIDFTRQ